jgi:hypothetical protein
MADERQGQEGSTRRVADKDRIQTAGRKANDALPLNAPKDEGGPERYPSVRQDDAVEARSFDPGVDSGVDPRADAPAPEPSNAGRVGPDGKPAEGAR